MPGNMTVLVRGVGDIGSAVAHRMFGTGYDVLIHDDPRPTTTRRGMAFADAVFDGHVVLEQVSAIRVDTLAEVRRVLDRHEAIPVYTGEWAALLVTLGHHVLVDARMRKHSAPEPQIGLADLTIGLGPALVVGQHAHVVVETAWEGLGAVLIKGSSQPLGGEPREIGGHARDRYVYAPAEGTFRTKARIGEAVRQGQPVAEIGAVTVSAPLTGVLRGLTHDNVPVTVGTKVIEVDPRGRVDEVRGIAERPRRIADGVLAAIHGWERKTAKALG